jgi:hypothetical protein
MLTFVEYRRTIAPTEFCNRVEAKKLYRDYIVMFKQSEAKVCTDISCRGCDYPQVISLGDCKPVTVGITPDFYQTYKEQGNNPMGYEVKTTAAVASIINAASDESKQREFLLVELTNFSRYDWQNPFMDKLQKMFNIDASARPTTSQALLDAFKNGKYTVDQAKVDRQAAYFAKKAGEYADSEDDEGEYVGKQYYGITFTDIPVEDPKGYSDALEEFNKAKVDTKRTIMIGTPAEGLAALKALESWKTTVVPNTAPATATA